MESGEGSYSQARRVEALEKNTTQFGQTLENIMHTLAKMRRENHAHLERLEKRAIKGKSDSDERRNNVRERRRGRVEVVEYTLRFWY